MKLSRIIEITNGTVLSCKDSIDLDRQINYGISCDLMSDVLMVLRKQSADMEIEENSVMITGLATMQAIRTAEMLDLDVILIVRGKTPTQKVVELAEESNIILVTTDHMMYRACGELYAEGLQGVS